MAEIENAAFQREGKSFSQYKKQQLRIDMTPLVDLGFLLITFFVFTTTVSAPAAMKLIVPDDQFVKRLNNIPESLALTLLLNGKNKVYYYHGNWEEAKQADEIFETNYSVYSGIGEVIRLKQKSLAANKSNSLMLLVKPSANASYQNVIDALDEVMINDVKKYAVVEPGKEEEKFLAEKNSLRY